MPSPTSQDARDLLVIPDLEKLLVEDSQWHFPAEIKIRIAREIQRMERGEYLP